MSLQPGIVGAARISLALTATVPTHSFGRAAIAREDAREQPEIGLDGPTLESAEHLGGNPRSHRLALIGLLEASGWEAGRQYCYQDVGKYKSFLAARRHLAALGNR